MEELSCQELVELVTDYLEDVLEPSERERFEAHLAECPGCDLYVEQMRATIVLAGASADLESRPEVSGLLEAFRDWKVRRGPDRS
jgi:anti-sigma factor RsiW